jgi:hypothetical protein
MAQSTKKQVTGKHGTPEKTSLASGFSPQDSKNSDWLSALQAYEDSRTDIVPEEWKTRVQLEFIFKLRSSRMRDVIRDMIRDNRIERKTFTVLVCNCLRSIQHYRLK